MQYALRYEDFSDFGDTTNGKIASRYSLSDSTALRGAISTGFPAPTPGQASLRSTTTTFTSGIPPVQIDVGLLPPTDPDVIALGGTALKEEESVLHEAQIKAYGPELSEEEREIYRQTLSKVTELPNRHQDTSASLIKGQLSMTLQSIETISYEMKDMAVSQAF